MSKPLLLSGALGFMLSGGLLAMEYLDRHDVWLILQSPGFIASASIWGVHGDQSGGYRFLALMVGINWVAYSILFLIAFGVLRLARK